MRQVYGQDNGMPLSPGIGTEDYVFISGQVPDNLSDGIEAQTAQVLEKIEALLCEAGSTLQDVVKTTVYITSKADFEAMNAVYARYFPERPPARSTVCVDLVVDARIEIEAIAVRPRAPQRTPVEG